MNAVESLLLRLQIGEAIPAFKENKIDKIVTLRNLSQDDLKKLIPHEEARKKLTDALQRNSVEPSQPQRVVAAAAVPPPLPPRYNEEESAEQRVAAGGPSNRVCRFYRTAAGCKKGDKCNLLHSDGPVPIDARPSAPSDRRGGPRTQKICREFFTGGCRYGDECKFNHDADAAQREEGSSTRDMSEIMITIPSESLKLLLGNKAAKLTRINQQCGTTNSRISRPEDWQLQYTFSIYGSKKGVEEAKAEIEKLVGITKQQIEESRFNYANHEFERNVATVERIAAANLKNKGTPFELSEESLKALVSTFRFEPPQKLTHLWALSNHTDKDKYEIVSNIVKHLQGTQAILFTDVDRVKEMAKRSAQAAAAFNVATPQFMHRDMPKEERSKALQAFKAGEINSSGVVTRLLITTDDYAKYARKVLIPYVNFVVQFNVPKTKEVYLLRAMCAGRQGTPGLSLLLLGHNDASTQKEWSNALPLDELRSSTPIEPLVRGLVYDTAAKPLTSPEADPAPAKQ